MVRRCLLLTCFVLLGTVRLLAQAGVAQLSGLVTDGSGAVVVGASVSATSRASGVVRATVTNTAGYYTFATLPIGSYEVTVAQSGFDKVSQIVMLDPSAKARSDFKLTIGSVTTSVDVTSTAPMLSLDDASIGTVIENETITMTPLFMRNWDDLIRLVPGVQAQRYTEQSGGTATGRTGSFNIHGVNSLQNNFILDGIDNNTFSENVQELSTQSARPSVDVIQEFKLISNPYTAEYGRSPGAVVDVTTKSGTNKMHGLLFEYLRNRVLDANDWYTKRAKLPKPENVQNQFGGNLGMPILKNQLFGFFNYEGTRIRRGVTRTSTVPLANERAGDFSPQAALNNGTTYGTIYYPGTTTPLPNNQVPTSLIDPYGQKLLNLFPLPNQKGVSNNYVRTGSLVDDNDSIDARVDWNAGPKDLVFWRYTSSDRVRDIPGNFGGIADGSSTSSWGNSTLKAYSGVVGWNHIFGPTLVNDFRLGFVRNYAHTQQQPFGLNKASDYVPGVPENAAVAGGVSQTSYDNYTSIGSPDYLPKQQVPQQWQFMDAVTWTHGEHTFKFGVDTRAPMRNVFQDEASTRGTLEFSGQYTGNSYVDGLMGYVRAGTLANVFFVDQRLWMTSGYLQDDWKFNRKLTLNLGLRYEYSTPQYEGKNRMANFNPAGSGSLVYAKDGSIEDRGLVKSNNLNFGPRFGFTYALQDKMTVRGGYGIYYELLERNGSENQIALNPPNLRQNTLTGTSTQPAFLLKNGFPSNLLDPSNLNLKLTHIRAVAFDSPTPYVQQWSLGFQRELPLQFVGTVDYVGTKSTHLDIIHDLNQYVNGAFPYPNFNYLEYQQAVGNGAYHGLEASAQRRFQNGFSLNLAYTWSKSIQTIYDQTFRRSRSDFDIPDRFVVSYVYELPFGKNKPFVASGLGAKVLGGWSTTGVYTYSSGRPFTVTSGSKYSNALDAYGAATAVPNQVGTPHIIGKPNCWFYVSGNKTCAALGQGYSDAFQLQQVGAFGNAGHNILRGPHATVFDFALMRDFSLIESTNLQFRWEVFNLTNTPMFSQPNSTLTSSSVGTISSLAGDPRVMQFALRLSF